MAKKKDGINKSEMIRSYAEEHPKAKPAEIAAALTEQTGETFKNGTVSTVLYAAKKKAGGKATKKKAAKKKTSKADGSPLEQAADFAAAVGGLDKAEALVAKLRQIKTKL